LTEGRLSSPGGRSELVKLATRLILDEASEAEVRDALGRDRCERGAEEGQGYRNGYRTGRLKTAEGAVEFSAPQVSGRDTPFPVGHPPARPKGRTEAIEELAVEMPARGLSVRDIEDAFRADDGRLLLSRTAVSELGEQLWRDHQGFATRDLSEHEIVVSSSTASPSASAPASGAGQ
jgi:transposase-like protein